MLMTNILTLDKYSHKISHKTNAYNSHSIRNKTRDGKLKKNDLLSDS